MTTFAVLASVVAAAAIFVACLLLVPSPKFPCYRCGGEAQVDYMGLHYCEMCRNVIVRMIATVQHDPPYGFPGAQGYLEFPSEEKKQ